MATISDILRYKGEQRPGDTTVTVTPQTTAAALVRTLAEHRIGAAVVLADADGTVAGIVSERDVVRHLAADGGLDEPVESIMTTSVVSCGADDDLEQIAGTMTERRIRHMPVLDGGRLVGIVSIGDVVSSRIRQLEHDRGQLEQYIAG